MALEDNTFTLANPFLELLGARLQAWNEGYAEISLPMSDALQNRSGAIQGGVLCTLLDCTAGYSGLYSHRGEPLIHGLTVSFSVQFIANKNGSMLTSKGYLQKTGTSLYFARSEVWLDSELLLATAMGTFRYWKTPANARS